MAAAAVTILMFQIAPAAAAADSYPQEQAQLPQIQITII
jgi:hypothetical protein